MLKEKEIDAIADELYEAEKSCKPVDAIVGRYQDVGTEDAYKIQMKNVERRIDAGERVVGKKIGLTSLSMQKLLGVFEPDYGHIFENMLITDNRLSMSKVISPKVEGEIAFIMGEDIAGPGVTPTDVIRATDFLMPSIEVIDSRVRDWKIKIEDTISDNASSACIVLGNRFLDLDEVDMLATGMVLVKNGDIVSTGAAGAVMNNPVYAVTWLINKLAEFGVSVKEGEIILSGSLIAAVDVEEGDVVEVIFDRLGKVDLKIIP